MPWTANRYFSLAIAVIFLIVGIWGIAITSTMQVGSLLFFDVDIVQNFFIFITGTVAMIVTVLGPGWSKRFNQVIGIIYLVIGLLGLIYPTFYFDDRLLGIMHANLADHVFYLCVGLISIILGFNDYGLTASTIHPQDATG